MNYIFISTTFSPGNPVYEYYKALGQEFNSRGFHVIFIYDQQVKKLPKNTTNTNHYTWPSKRPTKFKDFIFLKNKFKQFPPEYCISAFGSVNMMTLTGYIYNVKNRIVWIRTTQTQIFIDSKNQFKSKLLAIRKAFVYRFATKIYTNSAGTKNDSLKSLGINPNKVFIAHNVLKESTNQLKDKQSRSFSLVIVGRLDKSKGHETLFKQFKTVIEKYPLLRLDVIGSGSLTKHLKDVVLELGISKNIFFHGRLHPDEIAKYFSNSLIGISSSYSEAFGWVNIESLREGTPIISTETEGAKSIIEPGINGEFFYHKKEQSLLFAVDSILSNWDSYSSGAINTFNNKFNLKKLVILHVDSILA